ncbi:MAG TPA: alanine racemase [Xanthobacteraceae bacterium]|nr:alanine racemase [Xanthobacteraceae bacterium]
MSLTAIAPQEEAGGLLTIDLGALAGNFRTLAAGVAPAECAAVLKGDAYGTGLEHAAPALWNAGARTFFVAVLSEARRLRAVLPDAVIYVLNGLFEGTEATYAELGLRPVLGSVPEIAGWSRFCGAAGRSLPAAVHVDTGMNRLGLTVKEAAGFAALGSSGRPFTVALLMSHLACADDGADPLTERQIAAFDAVRALFPGVPASLANSAGTVALPRCWHDLVRPGIALYGGRSRAGVAPLQPVVRLDLRIVQVREVPAGQSVGYGGAQTTRRHSRIALVSAGYADGIPRFAGASDAQRGAEVVIAGQRCPLFGRVSMDLIAIDVTDVPEARRGALATLIGEGLGVDDLAGHAGTIGYEVLTSLGRRYHRRWI